MKYYLELRFKREDGKTIAAISEEVNAYEGRRMQQINKPPPAPLSGLTFNDIVDVIKLKKFRRDLFDGSCRRMGERLANYMEDREGWHGDGRRETIEKLEQANDR